MPELAKCKARKVAVLKCDYCGRRVPYIVEVVKQADGETVSVKNFNPTIKPGHMVICFRCARRRQWREAIRG